MAKLIVNRYLSADNADVLDGTDLQTMPGDGELIIFAASNQVDHELSVTMGGQDVPMLSQIITSRAIAAVNTDQDVPIQIPVDKGAKVKINLNVVASGATNIYCMWRDEDEVLAAALG